VASITGQRPRRLLRREAIEGYLCIFPWLLGFVAFTLGPMIASVGLSFAKWEVLSPLEWIGFDNFRRMATDELFVTALVNTAIISLGSVPVQLAFALVVALALNVRLRGVAVYRTIYYLPSQVPLVANALLWLWIFNPDFGLANVFLGTLGLPRQQWLWDPAMAKPSIILITMWGIGQAMMIFLAGLQGIPESLYEAAAIDGAGLWTRFRHVTLPMLSPILFFNLVIGIIASFQAYFTLVYITTRGGPANATLIYIIYLFQKAFEDFEFGYAAALAWVLVLVVTAFTVLQFRLARRWVYYEGAERK
jgi:multiple sugar transport system permease protein